MAENDKARADRHSEAAFSEGSFEDPRAAFRERLRRFREERPDAFAAALEYYEQTLIPQVAGSADPIVEWVAYGRRLGELAGRGQTVIIDPTGRARPLAGDFAADSLILHLPDDTQIEALPIAVPRRLSAPQRATFDLLINRARALTTEPS